MTTTAGPPEVSHHWSAVLAPLGTPGADGRVLNPSGTFTLSPAGATLYHPEGLPIGAITKIATDRAGTTLRAYGLLWAAYRRMAVPMADGLLLPAVELADDHSSTVVLDPAGRRCGTTFHAAHVSGVHLSERPAFTTARFTTVVAAPAESSLR